MLPSEQPIQSLFILVAYRVPSFLEPLVPVWKPASPPQFTIWGSTRDAAHMQLDCSVARWVSQRVAGGLAHTASAVAWAAYPGELGIDDAEHETITAHQQ